MQDDSSMTEHRFLEAFSHLSHHILELANRGPSEQGFMNEISSALLEFSGCDEIEIRIVRRRKVLIVHASRHAKRALHQETFRPDATMT